MKLVIAEKPALARDIARAICGRAVSESESLPISGNGYTVIACAGHLLELREPDELNPAWGKPWTEEALPIEVPDWPKEPAKGKEGLVDRIAALLEEADSVINAGDPDDEGQLIVDELLDYLGYSGQVERVYVNDSIEKNIVRAFQNLVPNEECRGAGDAAYARQMADMCFGVNESRLATKRLHAVLTVGRVQTPTLGLVVHRDEAIEKHISRLYYELSATGDSDGARPVFRFKPSKELLGDESRLYDPAPLESLKVSLDGRDRGFETVVTEQVVHPLLPYNLTVLLSDMSRRYGLPASVTQQVTQDLRDKYKAITYNRSDSQYLKDEHHDEAQAVLSRAMENVGSSWELDWSIRSKAFNDKNVTAHHAIIPQETPVDVGQMTREERLVYAAIVERYAMQFLPPAIYDVSTSTFSVDEGTFVCTIKRLRDPGFKGVFGGVVPDEEEGDTDAGIWFDAGPHELRNIECRVSEKKTSPPRPYTEGTLITDMASIAKYVTDPEVKAVLKEKDTGKKGEHGGIGTTATRASIIENLKNRGYLEGRGGKLHSTEKGRKFYHILPPEIKGADVTARWWLLQQQVADGSADVNAIQRSVIEVFRSHFGSAYVGESIDADSPSVGKCPLCGIEVIKTGKVFSCASNRNERGEDGSWHQVAGCGFKIFPFCGKVFTVRQAEALLAGRSVPLKGCRSNAGKSFDCKVRLRGDGSLEPSFNSGPRGKRAGARKRR